MWNKCPQIFVFVEFIPLKKQIKIGCRVQTVKVMPAPRIERSLWAALGQRLPSRGVEGRPSFCREWISQGPEERTGG